MWTLYGVGNRILDHVSCPRSDPARFFLCLYNLPMKFLNFHIIFSHGFPLPLWVAGDAWRSWVNQKVG